MSLRERFKDSRRKRARDITIQGIGDFKLLIPSSAHVTEIRETAKKIGSENEVEWMRFIGTVVARHVVDEAFERPYSDEEVPDLLQDLDPFALMTIYGHILNGKSPDELVKNSEPTPNVSSSSDSPQSSEGGMSTTS
jgi:hypothetical protein